MIQTFARELISKAAQSQASDLYMIPREESYHLFQRVRDRREFLGEYDVEFMVAVMSHFKFVSGMNVGEKRRTQHGSCEYEIADRQIALRLSTVGDYRGQESLVIRLLYQADGQLQFWSDTVENISRFIKGRGLYLFSGPVGSGKTTLMYHLAQLIFSNQQILTIEDPVEIKHADMLQLQLNETIGATYDNLIKLSLRHRPDLLMIGEIRDQATARAVIRASLTGATVFSTVHAKSIAGVYERMLELGVAQWELDNVLQGITYQRLIEGKGMIDVATQDYQLHSPEKWNDQIDQLFEAGYLTERQVQAEKIIPGKTRENHRIIS